MFYLRGKPGNVIVERCFMYLFSCLLSLPVMVDLHRGLSLRVFYKMYEVMFIERYSSCV